MKPCPTCNVYYAETAKFCPKDGTDLSNLPSSADDLLIRTLFAKRFFIEAKIGEGGMGKVYKATQTHINRPCAIKIISPSLLSRSQAGSSEHEQFVARFKREAALASRIDNSHVVRIYDFGETDDGHFYLAMEYVEGEPLTNLITSQRPLAVERAVGIAHQIADALYAAHALGIIHRDLKPDNILICSKDQQADQVKLLDFGIAKSMNEPGSHSLTQTGGIIGTPLYMAPEQLLGAKADPRADVYSFALIVYEMLTGRLPVERNEDFIRSRIYENPLPLRQFNSQITQEVETVVLGALERERDNRTPTVSAFASALADASQATVKRVVIPMPPAPRIDANHSAPPRIDPEPAVAPAAQGSPNSKARAGLLVAFGLILLIAIGYLLYAAANRNPTTPTDKSIPPLTKDAAAAPTENARSEGGAKEAGEHYEKGKDFQEKARAFANTGKNDDAVDVNSRAIQEFTRAISLQAVFPEAYESLALALCDNCDYEDSLPKFKTAIAQLKQSGRQPMPKLLNNYALTLYDLKMYEEAAPMFEEAFKLNPLDYDLLAFSGFALQNAGKQQEARYKYQDYIDKNRSGDFATVVQVLLKGGAKPPATSGNRCFRPGNKR